MTPEFLQWAGCATGLLGSLLLALRNRYSCWGWIFFLVSNGFWIAFAIETDVPALVVMQLGFTATSLLGVWKWLVGPRRAPRRMMLFGIE